MSGRFRVAILGTINRDTVFSSRGGRWEGYGGILYNLLGLSYLGRGGIILYPISNLGEDCYDEVMGIISSIENIKTEGIRKKEAKNNHCVITYSSSGRRRETLEGRLPPLKYDDVRSYLRVDLLLVNFISGFDIGLEALKRIRREFEGIIYMDLHSLTLGIDSRGRRFLRPIPQAEEWIAQADILQMNREEAELLGGGPLRGEGDFLELGRRFLSLRPTLLLVTLGPQGNILLEGANLFHFPSPSPTPFDDPTGCGDLFTCGFIWEYLSTKDAQRACERANHFVSKKELIDRLRSKMRVGGGENQKDGGVS